jgi:hypothetical protein
MKYFCKKIEVQIQILLFLYKYGTSHYKNFLKNIPTCSTSLNLQLDKFSLKSGVK